METEAQKKARLKREAEKKKAGDPGYRSSDMTSDAMSQALNEIASFTDYSGSANYDYSSSSGCDSSCSSGFSDAGAGFS